MTHYIVHPFINQPMNRSIDQSVEQLLNQSNNHSIYLWISQSSFMQRRSIYRKMGRKTFT